MQEKSRKFIFICSAECGLEQIMKCQTAATPLAELISAAVHLATQLHANNVATMAGLHNFSTSAKFSFNGILH